MIARAPKAYHINLVRRLREKERRAEKQDRIRAMVGLACFALLALAVVYSCLTMWKMERVLSTEREKLVQIQNEYQKYTATRTIVDKGDVELLNGLQGRGIFWTKKLAAMATHLPDNYSITAFSYYNGELKVRGFGFTNPKQDQLLILDAYLNRLRQDSSFSDIFKQTFLTGTQRNDQPGTGKVNFEFSAINPQAQVK